MAATAVTSAPVKPVLASLKTPLSATYPSELRSPMTALVATPTYVKREEGMKTPITPPAAYVDFLKAMSPVLMSPLATGTSTKFPLPPPTERQDSTTSISSFTSNGSSATTSSNVTADKPASPKSAESDSSSRASSYCNCEGTANKKRGLPSEEMKINIPPASAFVRPTTLSARTPRRLHIPQSPFSPAGGAPAFSPVANARSPMSAHSVQSPYSAVISPRDWDPEKAKSNSTRAVSVRQVVTRTVTYSRTPVDAVAPPLPLSEAPRGKRRKVEQ